MSEPSSLSHSPSDISMGSSIFEDHSVESMHFSENSNPLKRNLEMNACSVSPTAKYIPIRSDEGIPFSENLGVCRAKVCIYLIKMHQNFKTLKSS